MGGARGSDWEERGVYMVLVGKREGKRPLGRLRSRWEYNTKINLTCCITVIRLTFMRC
jgi:hypothetical protein